MTIKEALISIGFEKNEINVYMELVKRGSELAGDISKNTSIHRRTVYDVLQKLMEKGLVTYNIKDGKRNFQASNPDRIQYYLEEKENELISKKNKLKSIIPDLNTIINSSKGHIDAEIYSGKQGLKSIMELILKEKKQMLSIGSTGKGPYIIPYYLPRWHMRRLKLKIKYKGLFAPTKEGIKRSKDLNKIGLAEYKFFPSNIKNPQTIWLFGTKTAIILVSADIPLVFLINNKEISKTFKDYFKWMWKHSK
ncbi:MAG: helix-turn-helix domain-containing protein [Candidatus Woesearchaeota archaeon]